MSVFVPRRGGVPSREFVFYIHLSYDDVDTTKTYTAKEGMTWAEFVNSDYGKQDYGFSYDENPGYVYVNLNSDGTESLPISAPDDSEWVLAPDVIIPEATYLVYI